jgi:hypothetical protein
MGLGDELRAQRARSAERYGPEGMAVIEGALAELRAAGTGGVRRVGDPAPGFTLPSARGGAISLGDVLGRGPAVLAFYRGGW